MKAPKKVSTKKNNNRLYGACFKKAFSEMSLEEIESLLKNNTKNTVTSKKKNKLIRFFSFMKKITSL